MQKGELKARLIVAPVGDPSRWSPVLYTIRSEKFSASICSRSSLVPMVLRDISTAEDLGVKLLVVGSHSLARDLDRLDMRDVTEDLSREIREVFEEVLSEKKGTYPALESWLSSWSENVRVLVTQAIGSYWIGEESLNFLGSPSHSFLETFLAIREINSEEKLKGLTVDITHGINYLTVSVLAAACAFASVSGIDVSIWNSEPYVRGVVVECREVRRKSRLRKPFKQYLGISEVGPIYRALRMVDSLAQLSRWSYVPSRNLARELQSPSELLGLDKEKTRELSKELREMGIELESLKKIPLMVLRTFYAIGHLATTLVHRNLIAIRKSSSSFEKAEKMLKLIRKRSMNFSIEEGNVVYEFVPNPMLVAIPLLLDMAKELLDMLHEGDGERTMTSDFLYGMNEEYSKREMGTYDILLRDEIERIEEYVESVRKGEGRDYRTWIKEVFLSRKPEKKGKPRRGDKRRNYLAHAGLSIDYLDSVEPREKGFLVRYKKDLPDICPF